MIFSPVFLATLNREIRLHLKKSGELAKPLIFFAIITTLFPLAINPTPAFLQTLAPGLTWIAILLSLLLSLDRLFALDHENGTLEQIFVRHPSPVNIIYAKLFAFWLSYALPLIIISPLLAIALHLPSAQLPILISSLLLGTPTLCLLAGLGVALTLGTHHQQLLLTLLILPLSIPLIIFGSHCTVLASLGEPVSGLLFLLAGILVLSISFLPFAICFALRLTLSNQ
jgi:heme exporter protein B